MTVPILQAAWEGLLLVFSWPNIIYPVIGTLISMFFSVTPGLNGATLMALAIPFTLSWDPLPIMLIFGAFVGGATFMGSVTAILFNIPGRNCNAATLIDGHPMARQGQVKTAIGCSAAASAFGSSFGVVVLILLLPVMRKSMLYFGPPELLMFAIWGLTTLAVLTRKSVIKGFSMAGLGLLISFVGFDPRTAELRYTFGTVYLQSGLSLVPVFLGIFTLTEMIHLMISDRKTISGQLRVEDLGGSVWAGIGAVFKHVGVFLRSSVIGTVIGMIPGVGATVSSFIAYSHVVLSYGRRKNSNFGHGDIRGLLAPEAANDAKDGGALVPTLALGIPGGSGTALLIGALTLHGLAPGKEIMTTHLHLVFVLIWSLFFSNWMTSLVGIATVKPLARMTVIKSHRLVPGIFILATLGAYMYRGRLEDVVTAYLFGLFGYFLKKYDWPRIPLVIALVLGPLFETNLHITLKLHALGQINFWGRPIAMILLGLAVVSLVLPYFQVLWSKRRGGLHE